MVLLYAYNYRHYLHMKDEARIAIWNMAPHIKSPIPEPEDLVGHWVDGHILNREQKNVYLERKYRKKRGEDK